jgi:hypothetical protein
MPVVLLRISAVLTILAASFAHSQTLPDCPTRSGIYAMKDSNWIELPTARASKEKMRTGFPYHGVAIAVYSGASASIFLQDTFSVCASGVQPGTTFYLGMAKQKKSSREIKVGTYGVLNSTITFSIDSKQAVVTEQTRDKEGNYILRGDKLAPGQYLLFMAQGSSLSTTPPAFDFYVR